MFQLIAIGVGVVLGLFGLGVVGIVWIFLHRLKWGHDYEAEGSE